MTKADSAGKSALKPPKWLLFLQELRAPFFTASIVPVLVGTSLAFYSTGQLDWPIFLLTLAGMVLIHAGSNVANDYFDHLNGNDEANMDFVRPFTGGSRMIQKGLLSPREVLGLSLCCFAAGSAIGLYLAFRFGWVVLALGLVGVLGGFFYTAPPLFLVSRGIGEIVIGVNFGVLPVLGSYFVQTGRLSADVVLLSLPVAVLIAAVLFINQFQDYEADKSAQKHNWVVRLGRRKSVYVFCVLMSVWTLPIVAGVVTDMIPPLSLAALLPALPALKAMTTAARHYDHPRQLTPANALTVISHLTIGIMLAGTLSVAGCRRPDAPPQAADNTATLGALAEIRIPAPTRTEDAEYLGLPADASEFALVDIKSPVLLVQVFDMYCLLCQKEAPEVNRLFQLVQESDLKDRVRFLGIGKKNTQIEADIYRDRYDVKFPLFPDKESLNVKRIGDDRTPNFTIVNLQNGKVVHQQWKIESAEQLLEKLKQATR